MDERAYLELGQELRAVISELTRKAKAQEELPTNRAAALGHLDRSGPATIAQLAQACHIRHQSMTAIVQQMSAQGEVTAQPHPSDRRAVLYELTSAGRAELERDRQVRARWLAESIQTRFGGNIQGVEAAIEVLRSLQSS
jgi:DNA-binding MarR family transcriptional regulator